MKIRIHYLFFLFALYMIFIGQYFEMLQYFICVLLHEFSHAIMAQNLGYKLDYISLTPYGAELKIKDQIYSEVDEIKIALAGPICNLILLTITLAIWWIFPATYSYLTMFALANFSLFLFNLLPAYPLDGGRVVCGLFSMKYTRNKAVKVVFIFNILFSVLLFALFIWSIFIKPNPTYIFMAWFLISAMLDEKKAGKYTNLNLVNFFSNDKRKIKGINCFAVTTEVRIIEIIKRCKNNKLNIVYIVNNDGRIRTITDAQINKLLLQCTSTQKLKDALK